MKRIVIISGIQLSTNPRVFKEADALVDAGFDVTVLGATLNPGLEARDRQLWEGKGWRYETVLDAASRSAKKRVAWLRARMRRRFWGDMQRMFGISNPRQLGYAGPELLAYCLTNPADLYIVHNPQSLWVGVELLRLGAPVAADFEDWYSKDLPRESTMSISLDRLEKMEATLLRDGCYATTTSRGLSQALSLAYGCRPPAIVYNSFPESSSAIPSAAPDHTMPSIVWFSQVIGPGRGLETLMDSLAEVKTPARVTLRGDVDPTYAESLRSRAPVAWRSRITFAGQIAHSEVEKWIRGNDLGFAGEIPYSRNKDLTVSNKILQYLQAGVPVVASDTIGHREVADYSSEAVSLFRAKDAIALAGVLNKLLSNPDGLAAMRRAASDAARSHFAWKKSADVIVAQVRECLREST